MAQASPRDLDAEAPVPLEDDEPPEALHEAGPDYGGRGIRLAPEWAARPGGFIACLGPTWDRPTSPACAST
ncbi:MAG: hypothetical protein J2P48_02070 [Alphaproteobacteria bacterium]|nr:hypothetical protein [Alphaproteobacteria bacterium]